MGSLLASALLILTINPETPFMLFLALTSFLTRVYPTYVGINITFSASLFYFQIMLKNASRID
jgi:hypothetical protein